MAVSKDDIMCNLVVGHLPTTVIGFVGGSTRGRKLVQCPPDKREGLKVVKGVTSIIVTLLHFFVCSEGHQLEVPLPRLIQIVQGGNYLGTYLLEGSVQRLRTL